MIKPQHEPAKRQLPLRTVYMAEFDQWFSGLWHGRPLAYTIAVLAVAIALACFWVAWLMSPPPDR